MVATIHLFHIRLSQSRRRPLLGLKDTIILTTPPVPFVFCVGVRTRGLLHDCTTSLSVNDGVDESIRYKSYPGRILIFYDTF